MLNRILSAALSPLPIHRKTNIVDVALHFLPVVVYARLAASGFKPSVILDIGAYEGDWTFTVLPFFASTTPTIMIEAQEEKAHRLRSVASRWPNIRPPIICLLGAEDGAEVTFNVMETGSSIYSERSNVPRIERRLKIRTLDSVIGDEITPPIFMKLDVQDAELDVFRGGKSVMENSEVIQLEVGLTAYNEGAPQCAEVIAFMAQHGFSIYEICGFVRPDPQYLSQIDILFVRNSSKLRRDFFALV